jgi:hypothetical protein
MAAPAVQARGASAMAASQPVVTTALGAPINDAISFPTAAINSSNWT